MVYAGKMNLGWAEFNRFSTVKPNPIGTINQLSSKSTPKIGSDCFWFSGGSSSTDDEARQTFKRLEPAASLYEHAHQGASCRIYCLNSHYSSDHAWHSAYALPSPVKLRVAKQNEETITRFCDCTVAKFWSERWVLVKRYRNRENRINK